MVMIHIHGIEGATDRITQCRPGATDSSVSNAYWSSFLSVPRRERCSFSQRCKTGIHPPTSHGARLAAALKSDFQGWHTMHPLSVANIVPLASKKTMAPGFMHTTGMLSSTHVIEVLHTRPEEKREQDITTLVFGLFFGTNPDDTPASHLATKDMDNPMRLQLVADYKSLRVPKIIEVCPRLFLFQMWSIYWAWCRFRFRRPHFDGPQKIIGHGLAFVYFVLFLVISIALIVQFGPETGSHTCL